MMKKKLLTRQSDRISIQILSYVVISVCLVFAMVPLFITLVNSAKDNYSIIENIFSFPQWNELFQNIADNYSIAANEIILPMWRSVFIGFVGSIGNVAIGAILAYIFSRKDFPFKEFIFTLYIAIMLVPSIMGMPVLVNFMSNVLNLKDTYWGYWLPTWGGGQASTLFLFRTFFQQQPLSIYESAEVEGGKDYQILWYISIPLAKPILMLQFVNGFSAQYNDYLWPSLIFNDKKPLMVMLQSLSQQFGNNSQNGAMYAMYIIAAVPLLINTCLNLKEFKSGDFAAGLKL
ncbi:MAG: carbohydrate ABC transporter permease [Tyzzerella sp.]|nr:carbohydrate ABC transporter permease [Tyzzerella sp.]